jgi:hypothetical protein
MKACVFCGRLDRGQEHHPTAKDDNDLYLDPDFTVPACHDHHTLVHDDYRTLGIEVVTGPLSPTERHALRLRRLSVNLARVTWPEGAVVLLRAAAVFLPRWADGLQNMATVPGR